MGLLLSIPQITNKIKYYCAYQERSHHEVKQKLYGYGLHKQAVEELMVQLIEDNYLNEERFAIQFAGGRFRIKQWGRIKIKLELQQRKVSSHNIRIALDSIEEEDYLKTIQKLAEKKWKLLKDNNLFIKRAKAQQYLLQKGYENYIIQTVISKLAVQ